MPRQAPPEGAELTPVFRVVPEGTVLYRCHRRRYPAYSFNTSRAHPYFGGDRFGATEDDPFPYLYAACHGVTALSEVLLRSQSFDGPDGLRRVPWVKARDYDLSVLRATTDLALIDLVSQRGLSAVWQDSWLVDAEERDYPQTRYWVRLMRQHVKDAKGLVWESKRCRDSAALQLFGDRCGERPIDVLPEETLDLSTEAGVKGANQLLLEVRAVISTPWEEL